MRYKHFIISNYRAIVGPLKISIEKSSLTPIIGVNESGKTTILHAIFAFDHYNDSLNDRGRHLKDVANLYSTSSPPGRVEAGVSLSREEFRQSISICGEESSALAPQVRSLLRRRPLPETITIGRNLTTLKYFIGPDNFGSAEFQDALAREIISRLPYILYFDDFRDKIPEQIEIATGQTGSASGWLAIIEQLFKQTDSTFSVFKLSSLEERQRKTVLAQVRRKLNETLTKEWQTFNLDDRDVLKISIDFQTQAPVQGTTPASAAAPAAMRPAAATQVTATQTTVTPARYFITLDVVETDKSGDDKYFHISDRSKGFYWFFNFVMKLEFNPKLVGGEAHAIYLLDEPGSYLHAFAQRKLCQKLRQISEKNWVAYCTHSHYLLDPETIPINSIRVAHKQGDGQVTLVPLTEYDSPGLQRRSALQPVLDALQIRPFALDLAGQQKTVITEGIYDYFALELFRGSRAVSVLPSVGAESIKYYVSLFIAWKIDFRALWDNDPEGRDQFAKASKRFGPTIASRHFRLLPEGSSKGKRIIQNLFDGNDLRKTRQELQLPDNCSFEHTIHALFYSSRRQELAEGMTQTTKGNFEQLYESLHLH
jgi:energy-coupling factor transporter ATP-binding protein EcfA2